MRIVFMGTPDFAAASLDALVKAGHEIAGVYCQPDKPKNRGLKLTACPVKELALQCGLDIYQPASLRTEESEAQLRALQPELIVVVAYGKILPENILNIPPKGCINIHGSILPKYRGSAPIQWSVLNGESETGVTAMFLDVGMDTGDMIAVKTTPVGEYETSGELFDRLMVLGAQLLCETVDAIAEGTYTRTRQNESEATYAPPLTKDLCPIDWTKTCREISNQIRGLNPWPCATAELGGTQFKIFSASCQPGAVSEEPGTIVPDKQGLKVACQDGYMLITSLQAPGGKRMQAADYLRGHPLW